MIPTKKGSSKKVISKPAKVVAKPQKKAVPSKPAPVRKATATPVKKEVATPKRKPISPTLRMEAARKKYFGLN